MPTFIFDGCCLALVLYTRCDEFTSTKKIMGARERKRQKNIPMIVVRTSAVHPHQTHNINVLKKVTGVRERKEQKAYTHPHSGCAPTPRIEIAFNSLKSCSTEPPQTLPRKEF